jgi:branched-chain amino acid transport system substrate-binding protein
MQKYYPSGSLADGANVYGYSVAQTMVAVLKQCGNNLTRENLMKQAADIHDLKLPMLIPGITVSTSATDFAPIKQLELSKFNGKTFELFGDVISAVSN